MSEKKYHPGELIRILREDWVIISQRQAPL